MSSLNAGSGEVFALLATDEKFSQGAASGFLAELARLIGVKKRPEDIAAVAKVLSDASDSQKRFAWTLMAALAGGLGGDSNEVEQQLAAVPVASDGLLERLLADAQAAAADDAASVDDRLAAIWVLAYQDFETLKPLVAELLSNTQPREVQLAALSILGGFKEAEVGDLIVERWPGFSPSVRTAAAEALFARPERLPALLAAAEARQISATELDPARLQMLLAHSDPQIKSRAKKVFGSAAAGPRNAVVEMYRPVLEQSGDAARGKAAFGKICAACHKAEGVGHEIGPNLATLKNRGPESILLNVLDPNREVNPQYVNYVLITADGRSLTGLIAAETANSVTLTRAEGLSETILRSDIDELQSTRLSIMPEGLEKQIDPQMMADLIAYLSSLK
jgi:putative heme-binding domain-containing protein